jgi:LCP family protein required for cell wall assembly
MRLSITSHMRHSSDGTPRGTVCDMPGDDKRDYGWLYGGAEGTDSTDSPDSADTAARSSEDPEPTRVIPAISRPGSRSAPRREVKPAEPVAPPGAATSTNGRRDIPWRKIIVGVLVVWVVFLVAVPLWAWSQIPKVDITPPGARPAEQPGTTYLLVGSDSRRGLSAAEKKKLSAGGVTESGQRTDTIMLLHTGSGPNLLLSVPRDSIVPIPGHGTAKINAAFAIGGPKLLVRTIEQNTGVRIDHYVEIGFGGFVNAVDAVGGVTICPSHNLNDRRSGLHVKKGCQEVDGITALAFSRDRHSYKGLGDVQRAANQRKVVAAIGHGVRSPWTFINPIRYYNLNHAATNSIRISEGTGPIDLARFALAMSAGGRNCTVPISDLAVHWDRERALELFGRIKRDHTQDLSKQLCSASGLGR